MEILNKLNSILFLNIIKFIDKNDIINLSINLNLYIIVSTCKKILLITKNDYIWNYLCNNVFFRLFYLDGNKREIKNEIKLER